MARIDVTQATVLDRILQRLRLYLELDERRCYLSLTPRNPRIPPGGDYWLVVTPGPGAFVEGEQAIGNVTEQSTVTVTIYNRSGLDPTEQDDRRLLEPIRGLAELKFEVLRCLVGHDLETADGDTFLRQWLYVGRCSAPEVLEQIDNPNVLIGSIVLEFGVDFDWDLSGERSA